MLILYTAAAVAVSLLEEGSSSSPPQAPLITQPLSDSDDPHLNAQQAAGYRGRHYCHIGNFESDSFNENFSPTRPVNIKRKRKFKKIPADGIDGTQTLPLETLPNLNEVRSFLLIFCNINKILADSAVWRSCYCVRFYIIIR